MIENFTDWHLTPIPIPVALTLLMCIALAGYAWRHRSSELANALLWAAFACGLWSFLRMMGNLSVDLAVKLWWDKAEYLGIVSTPLATLSLALHYTGRSNWVTRKTLLLAAMIPTITFALIWTTEQHHLVWSEQLTTPTRWGLMTYFAYGPWFWVHTVYSYTCVLFGWVLILIHLFQTPRAYRWQAFNIVLAVITPLLANLGFLTGLQPVWFDFTPSAFAITMSLLGLDIFYFKLLDVVPVARRVIFDTLGDGLIVLTRDHRVADINPAAVEIFKLNDTAAYLGQKLEKLLSPWQEFVEQAIASESQFEVLLESKQQGAKWFQVQTEMIRSRGSGTSGKVIVLHDITQQKQNEQALAIARDKAMEADRFKTQLLAKVSHELRTPLSVILSYAEIIQHHSNTPITTKQRLSATTIIDYTRHLSRLVDDLLDSAHLEAGKVKLNHDLFSVQELIEQVFEQHQQLAQRKGLTLLQQITPPLPPLLLGDVDRLRQILNNLVGNAVKFTEQGSIRIDLYCFSEKQWAMRVTDTGMGIPSEAYASIFEPFQQLETSSADRRNGYGLGLAIVHQLTKLMQGEVLVESEPGRGSIFTVCLPLE